MHQNFMNEIEEEENLRVEKNKGVANENAK